MKERIKKAMAELGIAKKTVYSVKEMEEIAKTAHCDMYRVMYFLRFGK